MKNLLLYAWICTLLGCSGSNEKKLDNTFYCFNNCVRTLPNAPESMDAQAELVKSAGFDGFSGHYSENYFLRRSSLDKAGLKMPELYWGITLTDDDQVVYDEELREIIKDSKERDLLVTLFMNSEKYSNKKEAGDLLFADGIRELADYAAAFGVNVAIYPHTQNYCETVAHSVKLARLIDRPNAGMVINSCHLLKVEGEEGWKEKILEALPHLFMVSISGSDSGPTREMGWDRLIQPLGEGDFDTYQFIKYLKDNGYKGIFGLQCYNIQQDCKVALTKSINTWKECQMRYKKEK